MRPTYARLLCITVLFILLSACSAPTSNQPGTTPVPTLPPTHTPTPSLSPTSTTADVCPDVLSQNPDCYTPHALRVAYGVEALTQQGFTGKGQTIIDIVSYGSPTLQQDMDVFDNQFG